MNPTFGCAVNCIDGRAQLPVIEWVKFHGGVEYVDLVTEPGADSVLAKEQENKSAQIYAKLNVAVNAHNPLLVAVCGHFDCVANPVSNSEHILEVERASRIVSNWFPDIRVVGLFVNEFGAIDLICDSNKGSSVIKSYL